MTKDCYTNPKRNEDAVAYTATATPRDCKHDQLARSCEICCMESELKILRTGGIIEVAIRNPSVADYVKHWEQRAEQAEAENAALRGLLGRAAVAVKWGINDEYDQHAKGAAAVLLQEINAALKGEGK